MGARPDRALFVLNFEFRSFEFVSNFDIRISYFDASRHLRHYLAYPVYYNDGMMIKKKKEFFFNEFYIAGYTYYDGETIEDWLLEGKTVKFKREPECIYDPNAVEIYAGRKKLGYIPRKDNALISSLMDQGVKIKGEIRKRNFDDQPRKRIKISAFREV